jgi:DNA-directed RNA polymerase specialized sigma24 family protein
MKKHIRMRPATAEEKRSGSPYWTWLKNRGSFEDGIVLEPPEANPDVLSDENAIWKVDHEEEEMETQKTKKLKSALRRALDKLTNTDREIVTIMSHGCHNISKIAEKIGMSRGFVRHRLQKIQALSAKMLDRGSISARTIEEDETSSSL